MLTNLRTWFCRSVMTLLLMLPITLGWAGNELKWGTDGSSTQTATITYNDNSSTGTATMYLKASTTYWFGFTNKDDAWYSNSGTMTSTNCTGWKFTQTNNQNCHITTTAAGNYTFTVTWKDGIPTVSITYPTGVPANLPSSLTFRSNKTGWDTNTAMESKNDGKTWSYTLDVTAYPTDPYQFRFVDTGTKKSIVPNENTVGVPINNSSAVPAVMLDDHGGKIFTFTGSGKYLAYLITVEYANNAWGVYVLGQNEIPDYYISSNDTQVKGVLKDGKYYFTLPNSCYTNGQLEFSISKSSNTLKTYLTASSTTFSGHNNATLQNITDGTEQETKFSYTTNGLANDDPDGDIEVVYDSKANTLTLNYKSRQEMMESAFYLIVPNANVGNTRRAVPASEGIAPAKHTAFRLMAGRERNRTDLNPDLTSINLKIDGDKGQQLRYDSEGKIKFYIQKGNKQKFFQPTDNDNDIYVKKTAKDTDNSSSGYYGVTATNGVDGYGLRSHQMSSSDEKRYFIITKTDADETLSSDNADNNKTMSLTFMFSEDNGQHSYKNDNGNYGSTDHGNAVNGFANNGNLIVGFQHTRGVGSAYYKNHINKSGSGVYLVGKMGVSYSSNKDYLMTKIVYPDGATDESADSIVYVCDVKKGNNTWDNFFLSFSTGDVVESNTHWNLLLRPHVQDQMDGQALEGGVFFFKNNRGDDNNQQALNPLLSAEQKNRYVSYKVYFNATYSTYRIEFYDNFYIAGPAVHGQKDNAVNSGDYFKPEKRLAMRTEEVHGVRHYVYTGEFTNGSTFAFFVNPETYANNYSEDEDSENVTGNTGTMWTTQAPEGGREDGKDKDYPFYNHVRWNTDGDNSLGSLGSQNNGIKWTLPTGIYTLRFYNHAERSGNNQLYTIDKVVTLKNATSVFAETAEGKAVEHNYGGWRTFSDDCALWLPNGIKAYYASEITGSKVKLTEVEDGMIPAHTGVLIYDGNLLAGSEDIHLYPVPTDYTTPLGRPNLFVDCYDKDYTISYHPQDGKYNYFFTCFYKKLGDFSKSNVPMNFWKTRDKEAKAKKNYTYLQVSKDINPRAFNSETKNYDPEPDATNVANNARDYCFLFSLDDLDDPLITGITAPAVENSMETKAEGWYTMQGVKIQKPAKAGMYILNGRKVIVR